MTKYVRKNITLQPLGPGFVTLGETERYAINLLGTVVDRKTGKTVTSRLVHGSPSVTLSFYGTQIRRSVNALKARAFGQQLLVANTEHGEEWRPHPDYPLLYLVSSYGNVWSIRRAKAVAQSTIHDGYKLFIPFADKRQLPNQLVSRVVCRAFHGEPPAPEYQADHIDHDTGNNHASNLQWLSHAENNARRRPKGVRSAELQARTKLKARRKAV